MRSNYFIYAYVKDSETSFEIIRNRTRILAEKLNAEYWFVSAFSGENIKEFFYRLASLVFNKSIKQEVSFNPSRLKSLANVNSIQLNKICKYKPQSHLKSTYKTFIYE